MTSIHDLTDPPADAKFLPGRTVEVRFQPEDAPVVEWFTGVVVDVVPGNPPWYRVRFPDDETETATPAQTRAVNPDRPVLAADDLYVSALAEHLALRDGADAFDRFHRSYNDGREGYLTAARAILGRMDVRTADVARTRCRYTYLTDRAGVSRPARAAFAGGDRLVACQWFPDGPGTVYCAPHKAMTDAGQGSSIYQPTAGEPVLARDVRRIDAVYLPPAVAPVVA